MNTSLSLLTHFLNKSKIFILGDDILSDDILSDDILSDDILGDDDGCQYIIDNIDIERETRGEFQSPRLNESQTLSFFTQNIIDNEQLKIICPNANRMDANRMDANRMDANRMDANRMNANRMNANRMNIKRMNIKVNTTIPTPTLNMYQKSILTEEYDDNAN